MLPYPDIDPVAVEIGGLKIRWYGLMYMVGFGGAWLLGRWRASRPRFDWSAEEVDDLIVYCLFGLIIGARVGYAIFYEPGFFLDNPLSMLKIWQGGMSFHGGLLGTCASIWLFARAKGKTFFQVTDFLVPLTPIGLFAGRIGNFINGELYGKVTDLPWGMVFPKAGIMPRHPSQLYEAFLEGLVLFAALWFYSSKPRPRGAVSGLFLLLYGTFRFAVEFVRQPDPQLGSVLLGWITMGQLLSAPMILGGILLLYLAYRKGPSS